MMIDRFNIIEDCPYRGLNKIILESLISTFTILTLLLCTSLFLLTFLIRTARIFLLWISKLQIICSVVYVIDHFRLSEGKQTDQEGQRDDSHSEQKRKAPLLDSQSFEVVKLEVLIQEEDDRELEGSDEHKNEPEDVVSK